MIVAFFLMFHRLCEHSDGITEFETQFLRAVNILSFIDHPFFLGARGDERNSKPSDKDQFLETISMFQSFLENWKFKMGCDMFLFLLVPSPQLFFRLILIYKV